jgi:hypothetical protein
MDFIVANRAKKSFPRSVREMKKEIATFFRGFGSALSACLILVIGTGILASVLNLPHPLEGSPIIVLTIFIGGPLSILFILPAFILSFNWQASHMAKAVVATLNGLGTLCSLASMLWAFTLWKIGPINPG